MAATVSAAAARALAASAAKEDTLPEVDTNANGGLDTSARDAATRALDTSAVNKGTHPEVDTNANGSLETSASDASTLTQNSLSESAATRVLDTPELLEHILLQDLSVFEIVRARRVSPFFHALIDNSKPLRRAMFLEPELPRETITYDMNRTAIGTFTISWPHNIVISSKPVSQMPESKPFVVTKLHPLLHNPAEKRLQYTPDAFGGKSGIGKLMKLKPGLWQSMLISQPPSATVYADYVAPVYTSGYTAQTYRVRLVRESIVSGNTLGALVDGIREKGEGAEFDGITIPGFADEMSEAVKEFRAKAERKAIEKAKKDVSKEEIANEIDAMGSEGETEGEASGDTDEMVAWQAQSQVLLG